MELPALQLYTTQARLLGAWGLAEASRYCAGAGDQDDLIFLEPLPRKAQAHAKELVDRPDELGYAVSGQATGGAAFITGGKS